MIRFTPDTPYDPAKLPLTEADRAIVYAYPPPRHWCRESTLMRAPGGRWQWHGKRDEQWVAWGPLLDLSV